MFSLRAPQDGNISIVRSALLINVIKVEGKMHYECVSLRQYYWEATRFKIGSYLLTVVLLL